MRKKLPYYFILFGILSLFFGMMFGFVATLQYIFPHFIKEYFAFTKSRALHVTLVVAWILMTATGIIYYQMSKAKSGVLIPKISVFHFFSFLIGGLIIIGTLFGGIFGGREYMAFPPVLSVFILAGWLMFAIGFFTHSRKLPKKWPVYYWMWATGIVFFIFTFSEAHLWLIPYFRENLVRDVTVQWKSYGALIGSWNMLVYGSSIYIMYKIHDSTNLIRGKLAFALYFIGLMNLMFGWAHHCYIVPYSPWIRIIAYAISMSELLILGRIIFLWSKSLVQSVKFLHKIEFRFLFAADYWIVFNLVLAILMSVPWINYYTHGTFITVAHAMGTTIGINTSILISAILWIVQKEHKKFTEKNKKQFMIGFYLFHSSLVVFWLSLIFAGIYKSEWMYSESTSQFGDMLSGIKPVFGVLYISGIGILFGVLIVLLPVLKSIIKLIKKSRI